MICHQSYPAERRLTGTLVQVVFSPGYITALSTSGAGWRAALVPGHTASCNIRRGCYEASTEESRWCSLVEVVAQMKASLPLRNGESHPRLGTQDRDFFLLRRAPRKEGTPSVSFDFLLRCAAPCSAPCDSTTYLSLPSTYLSCSPSIRPPPFLHWQLFFDY